MSEDNDGQRKVPNRGRFAPGTSGNPKGRKPKSIRLSVPSQLRRDVLAVSEELVSIKTPNGPELVPFSLAIIRATAAGAANGKATSLRQWIRLLEMAYSARIEEHKSVELTEMLRTIVEDPSSTSNDSTLETLKGMLKAIKNVY